MGTIQCAGHYCADSCACHNCHNTQDHKDLVTQTIAYTRLRNPASFEAKVGMTKHLSNDCACQGKSKRETPRACDAAAERIDDRTGPAS